MAFTALIDLAALVIARDRRSAAATSAGGFMAITAIFSSISWRSSAMRGRVQDAPSGPPRPVSSPFPAMPRPYGTSVTRREFRR